ncbi:hypothetical protein SDC9_191517 [bioreactor metagenome]|uniref:Uncharacterized protein n=1 Tax=bioreactor metagenome TaxID=1076179 RepID=A0A645HZD7_9ZZZZ
MRPIGLWSMSIILSRYSSPSMALCFPGRVFMRFKSAPSFLKIISFTSDDLPLPDTPVTQVNVPSGIETSIFLRLFSFAPSTVRNFPFPFLCVLGVIIFFFPERYSPVSDLGFAAISSGVPAATISPPWMPAPGPTSII